MNTALERAQGRCELCASKAPLVECAVPRSGSRTHGQASVGLCKQCMSKMRTDRPLDPRYWQCLQTTAWSPHPPVQVVAVRLLRRLASEKWAEELRHSLFLEEEVKAWADADLYVEASEQPLTLDSTGTPLQEGDTVMLTRDLSVKGTSLSATRGTNVANIALTDDPRSIEGKVNGVRMILLAEFVKKA